MPNPNFKTNVEQDFPDNRDWIYRPNLKQLATTIEPPKNLVILNQGEESACTGFAMAATINYLKGATTKKKTQVSARMLYEMAKRNDEWPKENYDGSSLRGAIHGWKNSGVCSEKKWLYSDDEDKKGELTIERAKAARTNTIGSYYRLRPVLADFHAALAETGIIAVSAKVHNHWFSPRNGQIQYDPSLEHAGGHAFAIVGYNDKGFWVQNSWGKTGEIKGLHYGLMKIGLIMSWMLGFLEWHCLLLKFLVKSRCLLNLFKQIKLILFLNPR